MTRASADGRLLVSTEGGVGPWLRLPYRRVDEVRRRLDAHGVFYWLDSSVISWNGGEEVAWIEFGRDGDAEAVQRALDEET